MSVTEHRCLTCGALILDNTTSTTACVKCARLRTRRLNFASPPHRSHKSSDRSVRGPCQGYTGERQTNVMAGILRGKRNQLKAQK